MIGQPRTLDEYNHEIRRLEDYRNKIVEQVRNLRIQKAGRTYSTSPEERDLVAEHQVVLERLQELREGRSNLQQALSL